MYLGIPQISRYAVQPLCILIWILYYEFVVFLSLLLTFSKFYSSLFKIKELISGGWIGSKVTLNECKCRTLLVGETGKWAPVPMLNPTIWINHIFSTNPYQWQATVRMIVFSVSC